MSSPRCAFCTLCDNAGDKACSGILGLKLRRYSPTFLHKTADFLSHSDASSRSSLPGRDVIPPRRGSMKLKGLGSRGQLPWVQSPALQPSHLLSLTFLPSTICHRAPCSCCSVMSDSSQLHGLQHARPPCPSPTPGVYSNSCPLSQQCHPTISSSIIPFSSLQSFQP